MICDYEGKNERCRDSDIRVLAQGVTCGGGPAEGTGELRTERERSSPKEGREGGAPESEAAKPWSLLSRVCGTLSCTCESWENLSS